MLRMSAVEPPAHTGENRGAVVRNGESHTEIVGFHDQRHDAIHADGDPDPDQRRGTSAPSGNFLEEAPPARSP